MAGPLWITTQGYLAGASDDHPSRHVGQLLRNTRDTTCLRGLRGDYTILLVAPGREWYWLYRCTTGARSAFLARDPNRLALSSHAHLITAIPGISRAPDPLYTASMFGLRLVPPNGHTPYIAVRELTAGETALPNDGQTGLKQADSVRYGSGSYRTIEQWVSDFKECFENAVTEILPRKGEVSVMLSGGLDSGPVAAIAARHLRKSGRRITTTSWTLPGFPDADEREHIELVGKWIGARIRLFEGNHLVPFSEMPVTAEGPIFNAFDPLLRAVYEKTRASGCKVIISGGAGDRLYPDSRWLMHDQVRRGELVQSWRTLTAGLRSGGLLRITQFPPLRYLIRRLLIGRAAPEQQPPEWLSARARDAFESNEHSGPTDRTHPHPEYFHRLNGNWLAGHSAAENETAERFGLSRRDPFLNQELVRLMLQMPFSMTFREGQTKWQMRQAMKRDKALPPSIIEKGRTGLLGSFFNAGFEAARPRLAEILKMDESWREWVEPAFVEPALSTRGASSQQKLVTARCVGFCLWRQEVEQLHMKALPDSKP